MHEDEKQRVKGEKTIARIWERLGKLNIQEIEEKMQRTKGTLQDISQTKATEMRAEDITELVEGIECYL